MERMLCLRCGTEMKFYSKEELQQGYGHDLIHYLSGTLTVWIYRCPSCGKLEFFQFEPGGQENETDGENQIQQVPCPSCGRKHDIDDPKCPFCGYRK